MLRTCAFALTAFDTVGRFAAICGSAEVSLLCLVELTVAQLKIERRGQDGAAVQQGLAAVPTYGDASLAVAKKTLDN